MYIIEITPIKIIIPIFLFTSKLDIIYKIVIAAKIGMVKPLP